MRVNFQHANDGGGFLDQIGKPELEEIVEGGAVGLNAVDQLPAGIFLEEIERERVHFAEGVVLDRVGDALAAPGHEVAAAVAEHAAEEDGRGNKKESAEAALPVEGLSFDRQPGIDEHIEIFLEEVRLGFETMHDDVLSFLFFGLNFASFLRDLLHVRRVVQPAKNQINATQGKAVGGAEKDAEEDSQGKAGPVTSEIRPRKACGLEKRVHG
jgi:hypothetical protein